MSNRDNMYEDGDSNIEEFVLTPGPEIEAAIISGAPDTELWGALADRIMEDVEEFGLSLDEAIQIWAEGVMTFQSYNQYFSDE